MPFSWGPKLTLDVLNAAACRMRSSENPKSSNLMDSDDFLSFKLGEKNHRNSDIVAALHM